MSYGTLISHPQKIKRAVGLLIQCHNHIDTVTVIILATAEEERVMNATGMSIIEKKIISISYYRMKCQNNAQRNNATEDGEVRTKVILFYFTIYIEFSINKETSIRSS